MRHDGRSHAAEELDLIGLESVARFVVQDTKGADVDALGGGNRHAGVEASLGPVCHVRSVAKTGVLGHVVDDVGDGGGKRVSSVGAMVGGGQVGGDLADGQAARDLGEAQPQGIVRGMFGGVVE